MTAIQNLRLRAQRELKHAAELKKLTQSRVKHEYAAQVLQEEAMKIEQEARS
jgi:hypothetical protein